MTNPATPTNVFGWHNLPLTDAMLNDHMPYRPFEAPEQNVAERLTMLAHRCYNTKVWSSRLDRYWPAFGERLSGATDTGTVMEFWETLMRDLVGVPLRSTMLLHEKNLLLRPMYLPGTQVADEDVIAVFRQFPGALRDRTRVWNGVRRKTYETAMETSADAQNTSATTTGEDVA